MADIVEPIRAGRARRTDEVAGPVVLEVGLLASAFVRPGSSSARAWRAVLEGDLRPLISTSTLLELSGVLARGFGWRAERVEQALRQIVRNATVVAREEPDALPALPSETSSIGTAMAALDEARVRVDRAARIAALEALRDERSADPDRWRETSTELAGAALDAGRREQARRIARSVVRSFDDVPDRYLTGRRREVLVAAALVTTTGQEYLSHEDSDEAIELLLRTMGRLGDDAVAARLACRAAEIVGMRPHAGAFLRPWSEQDAVGTLAGVDPSTPHSVAQLIHRAERLVARAAPGDPELTAVLDVAWARAHPHHEHADERRRRLGRSLRELRGFDRAWAGTRLALDSLATGDRALLQQALLDASPTTVERSPLVSWRLEIVRAMLLLAMGSPGARQAVEVAAEFGERAGEPMAAIVAAVQRAVARVETDPTPPHDEELQLADGDVHPLIWIGRLELVTRVRAVRRTIIGAADPTDHRHLRDASELLGILRAGGMNPGNQQLSAVLLARVLFHLRDAGVTAQLVAECAELVEPLGELVPTDALGLVCSGSAARHLANLRALQGRHREADELAGRATIRDEKLGLQRFLIAGRIDAVVRRGLAGEAAEAGERGRLLADAVVAERRGLALLAREARLLAHPELHGQLDASQIELLGDLSSGLGFPDIARRRGYSAGTMRKMALPIYRSLGVGGRDEAVAVGRDSGLLPRSAVGTV